MADAQLRAPISCIGSLGASRAPGATGWPPDMGYWIGCRIDQAYYARAKNKTAALRAMLGVTDFDGYLEASGYPDSRTPCVQERPVLPHERR